MTEQDIKLIWEFYGEYHQKRKLVEELSELIRAFQRNDFKNRLEEIADVEIMLEQYKAMCLNENHLKEIEKIKDFKIKRVKDIVLWNTK